MEKVDLLNDPRFVDDDRIFCDECQHLGPLNWQSQCLSGQTYLLGIKNRCTIYIQKKPKSEKFWDTQEKFWE